MRTSGGGSLAVVPAMAAPCRRMKSKFQAIARDTHSTELQRNSRRRSPTDLSASARPRTDRRYVGSHANPLTHNLTVLGANADRGLAAVVRKPRIGGRRSGRRGGIVPASRESTGNPQNSISRQRPWRRTAGQSIPPGGPPSWRAGRAGGPPAQCRRPRDRSACDRPEPQAPAVLQRRRRMPPANGFGFDRHFLFRSRVASHGERTRRTRGGRPGALSGPVPPAGGARRGGEGR